MEEVTCIRKKSEDKAVYWWDTDLDDAESLQTEKLEHDQKGTDARL